MGTEAGTDGNSDADVDDNGTSNADVLVRLPKELRNELKEPMGPISTEVERGKLNGRLITVGDIVTYHFLDGGRVPDVSLVDGKTKRENVDDEIIEKWREIPEAIEVENPAATVTGALIEALHDALESDVDTRIEVIGEEDLATLPAIVVADEGDTVVYGQPDEGMVYVSVDEEAKERALSLLRRMDVRDVDKLETLLRA
ncbi:MAG: GTP-dependent dephospho-CoA kinase family protein [Halobacteria archaeon]|nr:GTP-dependent dephospho-CoA kinase family protein [Halobacteria archaeon]